MKEYVEKGKKLYHSFQSVLKEANSVKQAAEMCDCEVYVYEADVDTTEQEFFLDVNLTQGDTTIGTTIVVKYMTNEMWLAHNCEIINPETGDWNGEVYYF